MSKHVKFFTILIICLTIIMVTGLIVAEPETSAFINLPGLTARQTHSAASGSYSDITSEGNPFDEFPVNEPRRIDFTITSDNFFRYNNREKADQLIDWLLFSAVRASGISTEQYAQCLFDVPPVREGYLHATANFEYDTHRSVYIGNGQVVALIPADQLPSTRIDILANIADKQRKNLGTIPSSLVVFEYALYPDALFAELTRKQSIKTADLYSEENGYYSKAINDLDDLNDFMNQIDDVTYAAVKGNTLTIGGRKLKGRPYRNIDVEAISTIWQSEWNRIHGYDELINRMEAEEQDIYNEFSKKLEDYFKQPHVLDSIPDLDKFYTDEDYQFQIIQQKAKHLIKEYNDKRNELAELFEQEQLEFAEKYLMGIGFSLDPEYDYEKLLNHFLEYESLLTQLLSDNTVITDKDITLARNSLKNYMGEEYPEVPLLRLIDKLEKSYFDNDIEAAQKFSEAIQESKFQTARYDGDLNGTEVGMVLFYTDLLAKLWALNYLDSTPQKEIEGFRGMTDIKVSPIYKREMEEMSSTRLWFGIRSDGFQIDHNKQELLFGRTATRVYAASSNDLNPGEEGEPNSESEAFLEWWNKHYEEVARYEPEYERLNEIMKWSLIIGWLNSSEQGALLDSLAPVPVTRTHWFPEWVRNNDNLQFTYWDNVICLNESDCNQNFYPQGYNGTETEAMPILNSDPYWQFGKTMTLTGGVSLADPDRLAKLSSPGLDFESIIRRSNIDYELSDPIKKVLKTQEGVRYHINKLDNDTAITTAMVKQGGKQRSLDAEVQNAAVEYSITLTDDGMTATTSVGSKELGVFQVTRTQKSIKLAYNSRTLDAGQCLGRRVSVHSHPETALLNDPAVERVIRLENGKGFLVKIREQSKWIKLTSERGTDESLKNGATLRVSHSKRGKINYQVAVLENNEFEQEIQKSGAFILSTDEISGRNIFSGSARGPPLPPDDGKGHTSASEDGGNGWRNISILIDDNKNYNKSKITIKGFINNQTGEIYFPKKTWDDKSAEEIGYISSRLSRLVITDINGSSYEVTADLFDEYNQVLFYHSQDRIQEASHAFHKNPEGFYQSRREDLKSRFNQYNYYLKSFESDIAKEVLNEAASYYGNIAEIQFRRSVAEYYSGADIKEITDVLTVIEKSGMEAEYFYQEMMNKLPISGILEKDIKKIRDYVQHVAGTKSTGDVSLYYNGKEMGITLKPDKPPEYNRKASALCTGPVNKSALLFITYDSPGAYNIDLLLAGDTNFHQFIKGNAGNIVALEYKKENIQVIPDVIITDTGTYKKGRPPIQPSGGSSSPIPPEIFYYLPCFYLEDEDDDDCDFNNVYNTSIMENTIINAMQEMEEEELLDFYLDLLLLGILDY